jgi:tight adherence protein C
MPISVLLFIALGVIAVIVGGLALISLAQRRDVLARAGAFDDTGAPAIALRPIKQKRQGRFREWLLESLPGSPADDLQASEKMVQAGYDTPTAPATFFLVQVGLLVTIPLLTYILIPMPSFFMGVLYMGISVFCAYIIPKGFLDRLVRMRQERIRRSVPDALDLMVVCVEAGISLDAAILRVAKEIRLAHTDLAHELAVVNRKTNAGIPRDAALRGLWQRTGVEEIRALVSSMIQSEKWGTSVATVLRVSAETLRRKRRQTAEKKAKQAPLKMTFPLVLFILPALFIVIMGPALVQVMTEFGKIGGQ